MKGIITSVFLLCFIGCLSSDSLIAVHEYGIDMQMISLKFFSGNKVEVWKVFHDSCEFSGKYSEEGDVILIDFPDADTSWSRMETNRRLYLMEIFSVMIRKDEFLYPKKKLAAISFFGGSYYRADSDDRYRLKLNRWNKKYEYYLRIPPINIGWEKGHYVKKRGKLVTKDEKETRALEDRNTTEWFIYRNYVSRKEVKHGETVYYYLDKRAFN